MLESILAHLQRNSLPDIAAGSVVALAGLSTLCVSGPPLLYCRYVGVKAVCHSLFAVVVSANAIAGNTRYGHKHARRQTG